MRKNFLIIFFVAVNLILIINQSNAESKTYQDKKFPSFEVLSYSYHTHWDGKYSLKNIFGKIELSNGVFEVFYEYIGKSSGIESFEIYHLDTNLWVMQTGMLDSKKKTILKYKPQ